MNRKDDGGPAFPVTYKQCISRDYFAATAPVTVQDAIDVSGYKDRDCLKHDADRNVVFAVLTTMRYEYADAMLAERKQ